MSHHYVGPDFGFPRGDARLNLTDLYVFPRPGGTGKSILVMNVHPSSTWSLQSTTDDPFSTDAVYEFRIDTNGDTLADITYRVQFSRGVSGAQTATLRRVENGLASTTGNVGRVVVDAAAVSMNRDAKVAEGGAYRLFAGWRSDPFFFDPVGAVNNLQFTGKDFFLDKDVCSIVLEVPDSDLGQGESGVWARILYTAGGRWLQIDRCARPGQGPFLAGDVRDTYLAAEPVDDARFVPAFAHSLQHTGGYTAEAARRAAEGLLPDLLRYRPGKAACYPSNGRTLTDDVIDHFVSILSNGKVTTDGVGAHSDLLTVFPYLGPPHRSDAKRRAA